MATGTLKIDIKFSMAELYTWAKLIIILVLISDF